MSKSAELNEKLTDILFMAAGGISDMAETEVSEVVRAVKGALPEEEFDMDEPYDRGQKYMLERIRRMLDESHSVNSNKARSL